MTTVPETLDQLADRAAEVADATRSDAPVADADGLPEDADSVPHQPVTRTYTFKSIGGISMGACSLNLHVHHPGIFDTVCPFGGYVNFHYLQDFFSRMMFAGFCDRETIEAHMDQLNDPDVPELVCGPVLPRHPWEFAVDFNHWHYDTSGGDWDRDFVWNVFEGVFTAFGNLVYYNPDNLLLPPGVPESWLQPGNGEDKCANVVHVGKPFNYNAEFNPEGTYDLITFCDGEEPVPGGKDNPDYRTLKGAYDPTYNHTRPVPFLLAVDFNGNGTRDYHEPIAMNFTERFQDVGSDGCPDPLEDGVGGCTATDATGDPNGDNYHNTDAVFGTEGNAVWDEGEPYEDYGLDGVDGTGDYGEGDGNYSLNPRLKKLMDASALRWFDTAAIEDILATDFIFDGGIRDALHSLVGTYPIAMHLKARVPDTRVFKGYTEQAESLLPALTSVLLLVVYYQVDWSVAGLGKNFIVRYGKDDATPDEIAAGDGKHLGASNDMVNRAATMMLTPLMRWPDLDWSECKTYSGKILASSFYSPALKNRYGYAVSLPPCYSAPGFEEARFPLVVFLPGHGMSSTDTIAAGVAFNILIQGGIMPKFILSVPEGQCCRVNLETGERYCACTRNEDDGSYLDCKDPTCTGSHDECAIIQVKKSGLEQECNGGHFFANQVANRWGDASASDVMKYEDMMVDYVQHLEATYRLKKPMTVTE